MLAVARALVPDNKLLLIDEPSEGLAPILIQEMMEAIRKLKETTTILLVEQNFIMASKLAERFVIIDDGRILLHEEVESLKSRFRIVSLPRDREEELKAHAPKAISHTLGFVSAVLPSDVLIDGANYGRANLADIFMAVVGGSR